MAVPAIAAHLNKRDAVRQARRSRDTAAKKVQFTGEKPSAFLYLGVSMIALLKDLLDLVGIGSLPGIGTVVTLCFTFLIWILLTVFDRSSENTRGNRQLVRGLVLICVGLVEAVGFGLNFLPIETLLVIVLYHMAKKSYREAKKEAAKYPAA